jgi:molybdopterin-guanine dinucleotide biosynthesis protein A
MPGSGEADRIDGAAGIGRGNGSIHAVTHEPGLLAAAILAGGRARRLGGANKAALAIGERRIIDRQLALLRQVADPVLIVAPDDQMYRDVVEPARIVPDVLPGAGPLGGIYTALVSSPHDRMLIVACDLPFLNLALLQRLARPATADLVIPRTEAGYEPLCATWSVKAAEVVRQRIARGQLKAAQVVDALSVEELGPEILASCDPDGLLFVNVNTPHDYQRAQELSRLKSAR